MDLGIPGVEDAVQVGSGGAGVVYRARQPEFGRDVAVKVFSAEEDPRRVERERLAIGPLSDHEGVVPVYGAGVCGDGRPYLLMAFMPGGSLAEIVRRDGALGADRTAKLGADIARAVAEAHGRGIRHRDIKPQNILFDRFGNPRLADFGIAHLGENAFRTTTDTISGTVSYMAPEVILGRDGTETADIYSLGATLYFAVEGRHLVAPKADETYEALVYRRVTAAPELTFTGRTPLWLQAVLRKATAADPQDRYPSATELADALADAPAAEPEPETTQLHRAAPGPLPTLGATDPIWVTPSSRSVPAEVPPALPAPSATPVPAPVAPVRRRRRVALAAAALALVAGGTGSVLVLNTRSDPPPAPTETVQVQAPRPRSDLGPDELQTVLEYQNATKADPSTAAAALAAVVTATGQKDPQISQASFTLFRNNLGPGGQADVTVAAPGATRAGETYQFRDGKVDHWPVISKEDSDFNLFHASEVPTKLIPDMVEAAVAACRGKASTFEATDVIVSRAGRDQAPSVGVKLLNTDSAELTYIEFKANGDRMFPDLDCEFR